MKYDIIHVAGQAHVLIPLHDFTAMKNEGAQNNLPDSVLEDLALGQKSPIQIIRKARGMTQADLAKNAGISRPYLTEIETGHKDGSIRALKSIATALSVSIDMIV